MDEEEIEEETTRVSISVKDRIAKLKNASLPVSIVKKISASALDVAAVESISSMLSSSSDSSRGDTDQMISVGEQEKNKEPDKDQVIENLRREITDLAERHERELAEAVSVAQEALREQIQHLAQTVSTAQSDLAQSQSTCAAAEESLQSEHFLLLEEQRLRARMQEECVQLQKSVEEGRAAASLEQDQVALLEGRLQEEVRCSEGLRDRIRAVEREEHEAASAETVKLLQDSLAARDEQVGVLSSELETSRAALQQIQEESVSLNSSIAEAIAQNQERESEHCALLARCDALQRDASALEAALARAAADQQSALAAQEQHAAALKTLREEGERKDRQLAALREQLHAAGPVAQPAQSDRHREGEEDSPAAISIDLSALSEGPGPGPGVSASIRAYLEAAAELNQAVSKLRRIRSRPGPRQDAEEESSGADGERGPGSDPSTLSAQVLLQMLIESKVTYAVDMEREIRANFELSSTQQLAGL